MSAFSAETPVLWMSSRAPRRATVQRYLLWPVWAFAVLAPSVAKRDANELDILQQAVLRLFNAGMRDEQEIAATIHLHPRLVAHLRAVLHGRGLSDAHNVPSELGRRALQTGGTDGTETRRGYVFHDPSTGLLWGRFLESLAYVEASWDGPLASLQVGTAGSPRTIKALAIRPAGPPTPPASPTAAEVLNAVMRHRRAAKRDRREQGADARKPAADNVERVTVIAEHARALWLGVRLYTTIENIRDDQSETSWDVSDPFGTGTPPPQLRDAIERRAGESKPLHRLKRKLLVDGAGSGSSDAVQDAVERLRREFGERLQPHPGLRSVLVDLLMGSDDAPHEPSQTATRALAAQLRDVLGAALATPLDGHDETVASDMIGSRAFDGELLDKHAQALGFAEASAYLRAVRASEVRAALRGEQAHPRALLAANILLASAEAEHPWRQHAGERPALLNDAEFISSRCDDYTEGIRERMTKAELTQLVQLTLTVIGKTLTQRARAEATHA